MSSDPPELGKGLFGYRKSAVNQIIADRDIMLRQAEGRVRAAEAKVADLETELTAIRERNARMDEQLERLRSQVESLSTEGSPDADASSVPEAAPTAQSGEDEEWDVTWSTGQSPWDDEPLSPVVELAPEPAEPGREEPSDMDMEMEPDDHHAARWSELPTSSGSEMHDAAAREPAASLASPDVDTSAGGGVGADNDVDGGHEGLATAVARPAWMQTTEDDESDSHPEPAAPSDLDELMYQADEYTFGGLGTDQHQDHEDSGPPKHEAVPEVSEHTDEEPDGGPTPTPVDLPMAEATPVAEAPSTDAPTTPEDQPSPAPAEEAAPSVTPAAATPAAPSVSPETTELTNRFLTEELSGILAAAEESAARIVERARATTQHQIAQSNRLWREVQAEVSRFASWREEVEPVIHTVREKVEDVRAHIDEVPERIRQALAAMAESISSIDADLAELAAACSPPLLLTPGGLQSSDLEPTSWDVHTPEMTDESEQEDALEGAEDDQQAEEEEGSGHLYAG